MRFKFLLWVISKLFMRANRSNIAFQKLVRKKKVVFQLATKDKKIVRYFEFKNGRIFSQARWRSAADFSILFKDPAYAVSTILSKDKDAFTHGILSNDIIIEGDLSLVIWFQNLTRQLKKQQPYVPPHLKTIGFVGAGLIGAPMARSLMNNGFTVKACDKNPEVLKQIVEQGAVGCDYLDAFEDVDAVVIMVNTMDQVESVVIELTRVLKQPSTVPLIIMSTVMPDRVKALRKALDEMSRTDLELVDAPVSGAPLLAEAGKLSIMVGGRQDIFKKVKPVLTAMGDDEKIFFLGDLGSGSAMKLVNNIIGISIGINVIEAMTLGRKKGLDADTMARVINASSGKNFLTEQWPLTKKMFELLLTDTTYDAKSALFTTGIKDLETAKAWGTLDDIKIPCVENAIDQINQLDEDAFVAAIKTVFGPG